MTSLKELDKDRLRKVRNGEIWHRGSGKTTARLISLLYFLRPHCNGNRYLFITENATCARYTCRVFADWIKETGNLVTLRDNNKLVVELLPEVPRTQSFLDKLLDIIETPKKPTKIFYDFTAPSLLPPWGIRGIRYNKIVTDLTHETQRKYEELLAEVYIMERL